MPHFTVTDMQPRRYLLDTCAFLWIASDDPNLSPKVREAFKDPENDIFLSAASTWEIAIKVHLGKLSIKGPLKERIPEIRDLHGISPLPIEEEDTLAIGLLPILHKDPFDRVLIAQALTKGLCILTPDPDIRRYPILTMW